MLFPSTIIISSSGESIRQKLKEACSKINHLFNSNNPDLKIIDSNSGWGIEQIREIKKFLSQKPFNHQSKIVVIQEAENLKTEAQNALLKTLEEPGENNYLILTTDNPSSFLSTIISRCQIIRIAPKTKIKSAVKEIVITKNIAKDLAQSELISQKKEEVLPFLKNQLELLQKKLTENPNLETANLIKKIIKATNMINSNVDPKSALDYVFLF